jgi:hypothetical protein
MKLVRVPWIQCRADEVNAIECEMEWRGRVFAVMAYSEDEARKWWGGLSEAERRDMHGAVEAEREDEPSLF